MVWGQVSSQREREREHFTEPMSKLLINHMNYLFILILFILSFPVAQLVEHGTSNANIMGSIPRGSKSWSNVKKNCNLNAM